MNLRNLPFSKFSPQDTPRPWLAIIIKNPHTGKSVKAYGLIDTGADECALPALYAPILGHDLQSGFAKEINTGNGKTLAYSHTVCVKIDDFEINIYRG